MPKQRVPETVDLSIAINQAPADAVAYFRAKGIAISDDWQDVWTRAHARAFTVAKATQMDVLTAIRNEVDAALSQGLTAKQFQANLKPQLEKLGWWGKKVIEVSPGVEQKVQLGSPYRLNTIYRQNLQTAYMAGRYRRMLSRTKTHPYWQYVAIDDGQTRPAHARLRGKVFRFDDPIWDIIYPPNGWGCRCRVRALTEAQVKAMGLTVENGEGYIHRFDTETVVRGTGEVLTVPHARIDLPDGSSMSPDLGWAYNPGEAAFGTDVAVAKKLGSIQSLDTRTQFIQALNNSPQRQAQFAQWTDQVLATHPGQKRRPGLGVQALGFMTPSIQAAVTARLGREPIALLAITERQLSTAQASVTPNQLQQLPLMLANPEAVLWDNDNQTLIYVYPIEGQADDERTSKLLIASHWSLQRTSNDGQVEVFKLPLADLQQAQYQVLEGQLKE